MSPSPTGRTTVCHLASSRKRAFRVRKGIGLGSTLPASGPLRVPLHQVLSKTRTPPSANFGNEGLELVYDPLLVGIDIGEVDGALAPRHPTEPARPSRRRGCRRMRPCPCACPQNSSWRANSSSLRSTVCSDPVLLKAFQQAQRSVSAEGAEFEHGVGRIQPGHHGQTTPGLGVAHQPAVARPLPSGFPEGGQQGRLGEENAVAKADRSMPRRSGLSSRHGQRR